MMSIRFYFTVKQCDLPKLEMVCSSVAEAVRTEVKQTIGVTTDSEGDSSESKRGVYEKIHILYYKKVYICNIKLVTTCIHKNESANFL